MCATVLSLLYEVHASGYTGGLNLGTVRTHFYLGSHARYVASRPRLTSWPEAYRRDYSSRPARATQHCALYIESASVPEPSASFLPLDGRQHDPSPHLDASRHQTLLFCLTSGTPLPLKLRPRQSATPSRLAPPLHLDASPFTSRSHGSSGGAAQDAQRGRDLAADGALHQ